MAVLLASVIVTVLPGIAMFWTRLGSIGAYLDVHTGVGATDSLSALVVEALDRQMHCADALKQRLDGIRFGRLNSTEVAYAVISTALPIVPEPALHVFAADGSLAASLQMSAAAMTYCEPRKGQLACTERAIQPGFVMGPATLKVRVDGRGGEGRGREGWVLDRSRGWKRAKWSGMWGFLTCIPNEPRHRRVPFWVRGGFEPLPMLFQAICACCCGRPCVLLVSFLRGARGAQYADLPPPSTLTNATGCTVDASARTLICSMQITVRNVTLANAVAYSGSNPGDGDTIPGEWAEFLDEPLGLPPAGEASLTGVITASAELGATTLELPFDATSLPGAGIHLALFDGPTHELLYRSPRAEEDLVCQAQRVLFARTPTNGSALQYKAPVLRDSENIPYTLTAKLVRWNGVEVYTALLLQCFEVARPETDDRWLAVEREARPHNLPRVSRSPYLLTCMPPPPFASQSAASAVTMTLSYITGDVVAFSAILLGVLFLVLLQTTRAFAALPDRVRALLGSALSRNTLDEASSAGATDLADRELARRCCRCADGRLCGHDGRCWEKSGAVAAPGPLGGRTRTCIRFVEIAQVDNVLDAANNREMLLHALVQGP